NLRCVHCYNPTHKAKGELSTEEIYRIIDQLAKQGTFDLTFTGGEIFTRRDCFEVFAYAKAKGFSIILLTNATLITPEKADRIRALMPTSVEISIYGASPQTYERVTGVPGSFRRFIRGVELLRERKIPLVIKMPVMTLNQHEVQQAKALVEGWGIRFVYSTEIHPRVDGSLEPLRYRLAPQDVVRVNEKLVGYRQWSADGGGEKEEGCGGREGMFTCKCGKTSLAVTPYGQMNLCVALPTPKYDLRTGTVGEGWRRLVESVDGANAKPGEAYECPSCNLQGYCRQGPMDAYLETRDLGPCLPYFKELAGLEKQAYEAANSKQGSGASGDKGDESSDG
ncbi:radical SAM protein, partial [Acidobacteria bacterium AH-259-G07]|nr:radical SAM protein [Acidobacteria bacterium AH-259-G07]